MAPKTLPSNVDDPRFSDPEYEYRPDWSDPDSDQWFWNVVEATVESVPEIIARLLHR